MGLRTERIKLVGVDCPSCIYAIDRSLRSLEGLAEFKGDAATGEAVVVYDDGRLRLRDIARAIRDSGYDIHKEYLHLEVDLGEGEATQFEEYVLKLGGVVDCRTSPVSGTATVLYNPYTTSKEVLLSTIRRRYPEVREVAEEVAEVGLGRVDARLPLKASSFAAGLTAVVHHAFGSLGLTPPLWGVREYLYLALATVVLVLNTDILSKGFRALARGTPVMESLVSLSATVAYLFSLASLTGLVHGGETFFEASAGVLGFVSAGRYLEERLRAKAATLVRHLAELQVSRARVVRGAAVEEVPVDEVRPGDIVEVRAGERIPVDGVVVEGWGYVDESTFTGEPVPRYRSSDSRDPVLAGTLLTSGFLRVRATRVGRETNLAYVVKAVREAQFYKPSYQRVADRVVGLLTWVIVVTSVATFAYWVLAGGAPLEVAVMFSVAVLAVSCPCPLGIAVPLVVWIASQKASELGLLVKRGDAFERVLEANVAVLDKTGTLTYGQPVVEGVEVVDGSDGGEILAYLCSAESRSEHPLARAIVRYCEDLGVGALEVDDYIQLPGLGVLSRVNGVEVAVGSAKLMEELGVELGPGLLARVGGWASKGYTVVLTAVDRVPRAIVRIRDTVKPEARSFVDFLRSLGIRTVLATGDSQLAARAIAEELGIDEVYAGMKPEDKAELVEELSRRGFRVMFVGDGVNDAPAIGRAFLGVAMGRGADVSKEAGDVVVLSDIGALHSFFKLARSARRKALENLAWAFLYNATLVPLAAGALYRTLGVVLRPELAAVAMVLSDISVVLNSLSLSRWRP